MCRMYTCVCLICYFITVIIIIIIIITWYIECDISDIM